MRVLVTGGAGFIGSAACRRLVAEGHAVANIDKLTYAANPKSLAALAGDPRYRFERDDICDAAAMTRIFAAHEPDAVLHLAAESHVDRSISDAADFVRTNLLGTYQLLEAARQYWGRLPAGRASRFRFIHVSTDEVFGSAPEGRFREDTRYRPSSPYSASKAGSDHLAGAWHKTYGLPVIICNCSNNYGPYQFPEKLIPLAVLNAFDGRPVPVYGDGSNVRDWLFVEDFVDGLLAVVQHGAVGQSYNFGSGRETTNLEIVEQICATLDSLVPNGRPRRALISFVPDRPGHDRRYAIDPTKARNELGWRPRIELETGLARTVKWYVENPAWWGPLRSNIYRGERLGLVEARR